MPVDVIIPTFDNRYWLKRCLESLAEAKMPELGNVFIVDNHGSFYESDYFCPGLPLKVFRPGKNLGWTGALDFILPHSKSEFVLFLNDDTEFERKPDRLAMLLSHFKGDPKVAVVGPATGIAMGKQALDGPPTEDVPMLIGFCMVVRRSALDEIGGLDLQFQNGGDDFDLSARMRKSGYRLVLDRRVFVYHHAFKTGNRLYGKSNIPGGWNSQEMALDVYQRIEAKHGREALMEMIQDPKYQPGWFKLGH